MSRLILCLAEAAQRMSRIGRAVEECRHRLVDCNTDGMRRDIVSFMVRFEAVDILRVSALLAACAVSGRVLACEDEHPPVVSTPAQQWVLRAAAGGDVLALTLDPRGIGAVAPGGDDAHRWIDPDDSTGAWHYREWQWWKGHPWGDSCRPRYYADVKFQAAQDDEQRRAEISYRIDGFDCRQLFFLPVSVDSDAPYWDLVTTIRNISGHDVEEYGHFFASYTKLNRRRSFWYWDESGELVLFSDRGVSHLDGYIAHPRAYFLAQDAVPHCPRGGGKLVGRWKKPVMVSHASPAGWRSIIMIEPQFASALAQGIDGVAMDYILFPSPDERSFADDAQFATHIRHVMLRSPELPTMQRLEELWTDFERSHAATHDRAAQL